MADRTIENFRDLDVWGRAMDLAVECYRLTSTFPKHELYGLTAQIRRGAVSIASNLAEGHARPTAAYRNHVSIALGSHAEVDTLLELTGRLEYAQSEDLSALNGRLELLGRMLHRLLAALDRKILEASERTKVRAQK